MWEILARGIASESGFSNIGKREPGQMANELHFLKFHFPDRLN
jgi:hypothetical protein